MFPQNLLHPGKTKKLKKRMPQWKEVSSERGPEGGGREGGGPQGRDGPKEEGALWEAGPQARQRPMVGNPQ